MEHLSNFLFQIFKEKCTINPLQPNLSFLKQIKFSSKKKKKLTVINFRKIYNFEGKMGMLRKISILLPKKMMIIEERNKEMQFGFISLY